MILKIFFQTGGKRLDSGLFKPVTDHQILSRLPVAARSHVSDLGNTQPKKKKLKKYYSLVFNLNNARYFLMKRNKWIDGKVEIMHVLSFC